MNSHIFIVKKVKTMCMEQNFYIGTLCSSSFFYDFIYPQIRNYAPNMIQKRK